MSIYAGKRVVVTGASAGIGEEFAKQFHSLGANVVLVARRRERLEDLAAVFNSERPGSAEVLACDLAGDEIGQKPPQEIIDHLQNTPVDILVNNAGFGSFGPYETRDLNRETEMVGLNIVATISLAHAVIPQMKERRSGVIVTVSSIAGFQPLPFMATYAGTKAFNLFHSLALHYELAEFGVLAVAVCPGPVATEFGGVARVPGTFSGGPRDSPADVVRDALKAIGRKKAIVVPRWRGKLFALPCRLLPLRFTTWVSGRVLRSVWNSAQELEE